MVDRHRRCSCVRDLKSKYRNSNPRSKKKRLSSVQVAEVVVHPKPSLNLQALARPSYADLTQTIQASRFAPRMRQVMLVTLSMVGTRHTAGKVKKQEICPAMASSGCLEEVPSLMKSNNLTLNKTVNLAWSIKCKQTIEFSGPSVP